MPENELKQGFDAVEIQIFVDVVTIL